MRQIKLVSSLRYFSILEISFTADRNLGHKGHEWKKWKVVLIASCASSALAILICSCAVYRMLKKGQKQGELMK